MFRAAVRALRGIRKSGLVNRFAKARKRSVELQAHSVKVTAQAQKSMRKASRNAERVTRVYQKARKRHMRRGGIILGGLGGAGYLGLKGRNAAIRYVSGTPRGGYQQQGGH